MLARAAVFLLVVAATLPLLPASPARLLTAGTGAPTRNAVFLRTPPPHPRQPAVVVTVGSRTTLAALAPLRPLLIPLLTYPLRPRLLLPRRVSALPLNGGGQAPAAVFPTAAQVVPPLPRASRAPPRTPGTGTLASNAVFLRPLPGLLAPFVRLTTPGSATRTAASPALPLPQRPRLPPPGLLAVFAATSAPF